ncbi:transposable element Tcb1 transposase [Trichonephila clavipes]|nr:transposable element Tcb1 transposase [Trichonephila clavipes]
MFQLVLVFREVGWNQRFQDDGNVSRCYNTGRPRVTTPNEDRYLAVTAKRNRRNTASDLSRQLSSATAPGTRYHQENTIERHLYGGAGWLVWGEIILGSRTDLHVECNDDKPHLSGCHSGTTCTFFSFAMGAEFLFRDDNARLHRANIVDECLNLEDITRMDWPAYSLDLNPIEHVWYILGQRIAARQPPSHLSTGTSEGIA